MKKLKTITITENAGITSGKKCFSSVCIPINDATEMCFERINVSKTLVANKEGLYCIDIDKLSNLTYSPRRILKDTQLKEWNDKFSKGKTNIEKLCVGKEIVKRIMI